MCLVPRLFPFLNLGFLVSSVGSKSPCWRKLAELVTNHVFCDKNGHEFSPIVDRKCQADHLWYDHGSSGPGFDDASILAVDGNLDLLAQMRVDEWAFLD